MNDVVLVAALAAIGCGLAGLLVPTLVARLPEPPPDERLAELEAKALEGPLSDRERIRLEEGPKPTYVEVAADPALAAICSMASAVVAVLVVVGVGADRSLAMLLPVVPVGVLLAVVDLRTRILPRLVVHAATTYALLAAVVLWLVDGDPDSLVRALIGMAIAFGFFFVVWFIYPPGFGYGDVRVSGLCGLLLAYQGWGDWLVGLYAALLLFCVPAVVLAVVRRSARVLKVYYPFGPFLLGGIPFGLLLADRVLSVS